MSYLVRRLLSAIPAIFGVVTITFFLLPLVPGDPVDLMLGDQATIADKQALRTSLGLDLPLGTRYVEYLKSISHFDLGRSLASRREVSQLISERAPATAEIAIASMLIALLIGIPLGVFAATRRDKEVDHAVRALGLIGTSIPSFWLGPLLVYVFALKLELLPVSERGGFDHLLLPSITLAFGLSAVLAQITRAAMLETLNEDFIATAKAKGAGPIRLYFRHALANAAVPIVTVAALQFGAVLTGTVIIETIFDWPGIGSLLFQAIQNRDYPVVQGCVLTIALTYACINLIADLAYAYFNPKVRLSP